MVILTSNENKYRQNPHIQTAKTLNLSPKILSHFETTLY